MDSGVLSAGHRAALSPQDELDRLLEDMLRTVSMLPDPPAHQNDRSNDEQRDFNHYQTDRDIPYHARVDSAPFTYGVPGLRPGMLHTPRRLASPELVRRALLPNQNYLTNEDEDRVTTPLQLQFPSTLRKHTNEELSTALVSSPLRNGSPELVRRALLPNQNYLTPEDEDHATTPLQLQFPSTQRKHTNEELSTALVSSPLRNGSVDGYTSDTTTFTDDDNDFNVPLHVNKQIAYQTDSNSPQVPDRTSSRKFMFEEMTTREWSPDTYAPAIRPVPGLLLQAESINNTTIIRERSQSFSREYRPGTPLFPTHPRTPYPPTPSLSARPPRSTPVTRKEPEVNSDTEYLQYSTYGSRRSSIGGSEPQPVAPDNVRFVRDTSSYWYKPNISRDDAIAALQPLEEGAFIVRDSNSFPGAFGLAVRVGPNNSVRHFLLEPTSKGVRLRGCSDEPVFSSLSALIYQHTVTPLALPVNLKLPERDLWPSEANTTARALLATGAACHVLLLGSENTEALTGPAAVKRAVANIIRRKLPAYVVHFKVFGGGITLTDSARKMFFRRHYPASAVSYAGLDPEDRQYMYIDAGNQSEKRIFAFVARASSGADNQCHVFAELEPEQPATAIVNFINKVLLGNSQKKDII